MSSPRPVLFAVVSAALVAMPVAAFPPGSGDGDKPTKSDVHGDPLPEFAVARLGTVRWRQSFSFGNGLSQASMSPDSKRVVAVSRGVVFVWDIDSGKLGPAIPLEDAAAAAAFLPDGKTLLTLERGLANLPGMPMHFTMRYRDAASGAVRKERRIDGGAFNRGFIGYSADGRHVLAGDNAPGSAGTGGFEVYDAKSGDRQLSAEQLADCGVGDLSRDAKRMAHLDEEGNLRVYDIAQQKQVFHQRADETRSRRGFVCFTISPDGQRVLSTVTGELSAWEIDTGKRHSFRTAAIDAVYSPDGKQLAFFNADGIHLCDAESCRVLRTFEKPATEVRQLAFSPDGKRIVTGHPQALGIWDVATGKQLNRTPGHEAAVEALVFMPDGKSLVTGSADGQAILWDLDRNKIVRRFPGHHLSAFALAVSPDGRTLATGEGSLNAVFVGATHEAQIRLWNLGDGRMQKQFTGHLNSVDQLEYSPDGQRLASGGGDGRVCVWNGDGKRQGLFRTNGWRTKAAFSADGKTLLVGDEKDLQTFDVRSGDSLHRLGKAKEHMTFSALGFRKQPFGIETFNDGAQMSRTVLFWDPSTGSVSRRSPAIRSAALYRPDGRSGMALSPDAAILACATWEADGDRSTIQLFDAKSGQLLQSLHGHSGAIEQLAFSPDGNLLASAGDDSTVLVWDVRDAGRIAAAQGPSGASPGPSPAEGLPVPK